jgi:hypothetical protein
MPTTQASTTTFPDHRVFGFDQRGQLRANLYNGPGLPHAGALYSWTFAPTFGQLADKLAKIWEQPLSDDEFEMLEEFEASNAEPRCSTCNGANVAMEPYECGTDRETGYSDSGDVIHCLDCDAREQYEPGTPAIPKPAASKRPAITPRVAA